MTSTTISPAQRHFLVSIDVADGRARTDLVPMQDGLQRAAEIARREGMLTSHDDENTIVTGIGVSACPDIADVVLAFYGGRVEGSDQARKAITEALGVIASNFSVTRLEILNEKDRELLVKGIGLVHATSEKNQEGLMADIVRNGCHAWIQQPDAEIIREAVLADYCIDEMEVEEQVEVLRLLARNEAVMRLIQEGASEEELVRLRMKLEETLDCLAQESAWEQAAPLVEHLLDELGATLTLRQEPEEATDSPGM